MDWKTLFLSADGRIGRQNFWIGWLAIVGVNVVLGWIPVIGWILSLVGVYASVCVFSKRLHDMGRSGWLQVVPYAVTAVLMGVAMATGGMAVIAASQTEDPTAMMGGMGAAMLCGFLAIVVGLGFTIWCGVALGDPETNRYGPPPATAVVV